MVPTVVFSVGPVSCRRSIFRGYYLATVGCMMAEVICVDFPVSQGETPDEHQGEGGDCLTRMIAAGGRGWERECRASSRFLRDVEAVRVVPVAAHGLDCLVAGIYVASHRRFSRSQLLKAVGISYMYM